MKKIRDIMEIEISIHLDINNNLTEIDFKNNDSNGAPNSNSKD